MVARGMVAREIAALEIPQRLQPPHLRRLRMPPLQRPLLRPTQPTALRLLMQGQTTCQAPRDLPSADRRVASVDAIQSRRLLLQFRLIQQLRLPRIQPQAHQPLAQAQHLLQAMVVVQVLVADPLPQRSPTP